MADAAARSLSGQGVVGEVISAPWFAGTWEVTQGWGPTDFGGEPEGHGYSHWHAGVDVGVDCGTVLTLPLELAGTARSFDNPGGYGLALVILLRDASVGILLGHLRQRLVDDGQVVAGGTQLAVTNSTGNSTGCHLHFEVRPQDPRESLGITRYGTDVDPSGWLLTGTGPGAGVAPAQAQQLSAASDLGSALGSFFGGLVHGGEVLLGGGLVLAGLVAVGYGARGGSAGELREATGRRLRGLNAPQRVERRPRPQPVSAAAESRVRPDLQRPAEEVSRADAERALASGRRLSPAEARALGAVPRP